MPWDTTTFNPAEDWSLFDGVVTIGYYRYDPQTDSLSSDSVPIVALFREMSWLNQPVMQGETTTEAVTIHLPVAQLAAKPRRLDKITYGSSNFYVQEARQSTMGTRWKVETTRGP